MIGIYRTIVVSPSLTCLVGDSLSNQSLSRPGGAVQQHTAWGLDTQVLEESGVPQRQLDHLADLHGHVNQHGGDRVGGSESSLEAGQTNRPNDAARHKLDPVWTITIIKAAQTPSTSFGITVLQ